MLDKMLDKISHWIVQRSFRRQAKRFAEMVTVAYPKFKAEHPNTSEAEIIKAFAFDSEALSQMSESSRMFVEICCQTIQGYCYMKILDPDREAGIMGFRSQEVTNYIDKELEARGFKPQSEKQKERILETMDKYRLPLE